MCIRDRATAMTGCVANPMMAATTNAPAGLGVMWWTASFRVPPALKAAAGGRAAGWSGWMKAAVLSFAGGIMTMVTAAVMAVATVVATTARMPATGRPVSYTHLDVYKRQACRSAIPTHPTRNWVMH